MKQQLELHHIDKRLSKGVKGSYNKTPFDGQYTQGILELRDDDISFFLGNCKPILHPLTDLKKEIVHNGERFVPIEKIGSQFDCFEIQLIAGNIPTSQRIEISKVSYEVYDWLLSHHFDVDNLIEKGLAISVNDLKDNPYE